MMFDKYLIRKIEHMSFQLFFTAFLLLSLISCQEYKLEFDWKLNTLSTGVDKCQVTWNEHILLTLKELTDPNTVHHEQISIDLEERVNIISFFYIGLRGKMTIDNVRITKPPKTINYIINGDFEMSSLDQHPSITYTGKISGWKGPKITIAKGEDLLQSTKTSQALVLSAQNKEISQKISFGRVKKYCFIESFGEDVQRMAKEIIAKKLEQYNLNLGHSQYDSSDFANDPSQSLNSEQGSQYLSQVVSGAGQIQLELMEKLNSLKEKQFAETGTSRPDLNSIQFPQLPHSQLPPSMPHIAPPA